MFIVFNSVDLAKLEEHTGISCRSHQSKESAMELMEEGVLNLSKLVFGVGKEQYAIDVLAVQESCSYSRVTEVAKTRLLQGVVNHRGIIVPL